MADRKLRILQVLRAPVGGLYRHVIDLTTELISRGHEVGLIMDRASADAQTDARLDPIRSRIKLGIHDIRMPRVLGVADFTSLARTRKLVGRTGARIIHGHGAKGGFNARLAGIGRPECAALYTPHGGVLNFEQKSLGGRAFRLIEKALRPATAGFIFESAFAREAYFEQVGAPNGLTETIHNGLAASEFDPVPLTVDACDFVFIGELREVKGIPILLEALRPLRRKDGTPATLIIAGGGPLENRIREQIRELGLSTRVTLAGVRPAREMLARGRCAVVPSLKESLPYVILEAVSAGRPVIATDVGGVSEIFGPTASDLIEAGVVAPLQAALQSYLDHPETAGAAHRKRFAYVKGEFNIVRMADQIEQLYYRCLERT